MKIDRRPAVCRRIFGKCLRAPGADNSLKTIDNPGGGQIIYGLLNDQSSLKDAMVAMLRNISRALWRPPRNWKVISDARK